MIAVREINMPNNCEECKFCINQKTNDYGSSLESAYCRKAW